jgi:hypothetical protein
VPHTFAALVCLGTAQVPSVASASPPDAEIIARARAAAGEGYDALQQKDFERAAELFQQADSLVSAPTIKVDLARALVALGHLVEAREKYLEILRRGVPENAPKSWKAAHQDAVTELPSIEQRLATFTVSVKGADSPLVSLNGVVIAPNQIGIPLAVDPGALTLRVAVEGHGEQMQSILLADGEHREVEIAFAPPAVPARIEPSRPASTSAPTRLEGWVWVGTAVASLAAVIGAALVRRRSRRSKVAADFERPSEAAPASGVIESRTGEVAPGAKGRVFISYRRDDSRDIVGRIDDHLVRLLGREGVFLDVDAIPIGVNFRRHIEQAVSNCDAVLAIIGRSWLTVTDKHGRPRIHGDADYLRLELETAILHGIPIVPVLVQEAKMPEPGDLPASLRDLGSLQAASIDPDPHFLRSFGRLQARLQALLAAGRTRPTPERATLIAGTSTRYRP